MTPDLSLDLTGKTAEDWFASLEDLTEESGYIEQVSDKHAALFIDAGRKLLVTFEKRSTIMERPRAVPRGFELVSKNGWSLLTTTHGSAILACSAFLTGRSMMAFSRILTTSSFLGSAKAVMPPGPIRWPHRGPGWSWCARSPRFPHPSRDGIDGSWHNAGSILRRATAMRPT